jgi:AraC-like DNA-binding protein
MAMVVLLDTATIAPRERNDAMMAILSTAAVPFEVSHNLPNELIHNHTQLWDVGVKNSVIRTQDTNMRFQRTSRSAHADDRELYAMSFQHQGSGVHVTDSSTVIQRSGSLCLENLASVRSFEYDGRGDSGSFLMSHDDLALPISSVLDAATRLASSPLYRLVQVHLSRLGEVAGNLPPNSEASALLAQTTIQLIRALLASTATATGHQKDAARDAQHAVVLTYVRQHLRDPTLNAQKIATATHISVRQVYKMWEGNGESLSEWILHERLDGARRDLAMPESLLTTIEIISRRWGFVDPSHFSRRFREAYGSSPRDWRMYGASDQARGN